MREFCISETCLVADLHHLTQVVRVALFMGLDDQRSEVGQKNCPDHREALHVDDSEMFE